MAIVEQTRDHASRDGRDSGLRSSRIESRGLAGAGFIAIMGLIAYEWIFSGFTKVVRGGFPSGLAGALHGMRGDMPAWYGRFVDSVVLPHVHVFAVLIELGELIVGFTFMAAVVLAATRWRHLSDRARTAALAAVLAAALTGAFMALNFHFAMGANAPWQLPKNGFDEGVDLDSLMIAAQLVIAAVSARALLASRGARVPLAVVGVMIAAAFTALAAAGLGAAPTPTAKGTSSDALPRVGPGPVTVALPANGYDLTLLSPNRQSGVGTLTVRLAKGGHPVAGARVRLMFSMTSMRSGSGMASVSETLAATAAGTYSAKAPALGMAGDWLVGIAVTLQRGAPLGAAVTDTVRG